MNRIPALALILLVTVGGMGQSCNTGIMIEDPMAGSPITTPGPLMIRTTVHDDLSVYVDRVEFWHDGALAHTDFAPPYDCPWQVTADDNGSHTWEARALAQDGKQYSDSIGIAVAISGGDPQLVGMVPAAGTARDVVVDAAQGLAYVASDEFGISVVDVSNPAQPVVLGAPLPSFGGNHLAVGGGLAVVTNGDGLRVVDVSDPLQPVTRGELPGNWKGVALSADGSFAFARLSVAGNPSHEDLAVVDLRNPASPTVVAQAYAAWGDRLERVGSRVYVTAGSNLRIFDVSNPFAPQSLGSRAIPGGAGELAVSGSHAYVGNSTAIHVVSVANPANPQLVGSVSGSSSDLSSDGGRLYALSGETLRIYGLGNPGSPSLLGSGSGFASGRGMAPLGSLAFVASPAAEGQGGLYVLDVSSPAAPGVLSHLPNSPSSNRAVASSGNLAVATSGSRLEVVDVSDPTVPESLGGLDGNWKGVAVSGDFAFARLGVAGNPGHDDLVVIHLGNPAAPTVVNQLYLDWGDALALEGTRLYVSAGGKLRIFDVSNPSSPQSRGSLTIPGGVDAVAIEGSRAYVGNSSGLRVVDVSNPWSPGLIASFGGSSWDLAVADGRLYTLAGPSFDIYDVSGGGTPNLMGTATGFPTAWAIGVAGSRVVLASPASGGSVSVFDASNPAAPQLEAELSVPGGARSVGDAAAGVLVGDDAAILTVLEL